MSVDLEALVRVGRIGDFAAFGAVTSRYAVAVQESLGLPVDGVVAGDAKGVAIPSGFARVEAFRDGFLTGSAQSCTTRYR